MSKKSKFPLKIIFLAICLILAGYFTIKPKIVDVKPPLAQVLQILPEKIIEEKPIELIFTGDIMLDRGVEAEMEKQNDWRWPFLKIADYLKTADIVFGNLEGPISDKGEKSDKTTVFRFDPKAIEGLSYAHFNVLSLANNHTLDYGNEALEDTILRLKEAGIDFAPLVKETSGTKFAFLAYTDFCSSSQKTDMENFGLSCLGQGYSEILKKDIESADESADIVIVSFHYGKEFTQSLSQNQIDFSKAAIDAGADLIVGHHPHVVQKYEIYKDKYIFYSLGNFIFDHNFSEETMQGLMVKVLVEDKEIKKIIPINIKINSNFQPEIKTAEELSAATSSAATAPAQKPTSPVTSINKNMIPVLATPSTPNIIKRILSWGHVAATSARKIDTIIIHSSYDALGKDPHSVDGVIKEYEIYKVSPHFLISKTGIIYQLAPENDIAYHAGTSKMSDGRVNVNNFSIGIELIYKDNEEPDLIQYDSLAKLTAYFQKKYGISKNNIVGHNDISPERKTDPWNFNWDIFYESLAEQNELQKTSFVLISADKLRQGDTLLIQIENAENVSGQFNSKEIKFFEANGKIFGLVGISAKTAPGNYNLTINFTDGQKIKKQIEVSDANFRITVLAFTPELEAKGYNATSVVQAIASNDGVKIYEAMEISSASPYFSQSFAYPLAKIVNVGIFGSIRKSGSNSLQHLGVDLDADMDTSIYAINDGVVTGVLDLINYGNTVVIDHGLGIFSLYLHLNEFKVDVGQKVKKGQVLGLSGNTGYSISPHLHFSIKLNGSSVDPLEFIKTAQF